MIHPMTNEIRLGIKEYLDLSGITQVELAEASGKHPVQVNRILTGAEGKLPGMWESTLEALGLKLVVVPVDADLDALALVRQKALAVRGTEKRLKKLGKKKLPQAGKATKKS
jgi:Helix-turn-helix